MTCQFRLLVSADSIPHEKQENICAAEAGDGGGRFSPGDTESGEAAAPVQTGPSAAATAAAAQEKYCCLQALLSPM